MLKGQPLSTQANRLGMALVSAPRLNDLQKVHLAPWSKASKDRSIKTQWAAVVAVAVVHALHSFF